MSSLGRLSTNSCGRDRRALFLQWPYPAPSRHPDSRTGKHSLSPLSHPAASVTASQSHTGFSLFPTHLSYPFHSFVPWPRRCPILKAEDTIGPAPFLPPTTSFVRQQPPTASWNDRSFAWQSGDAYNDGCAGMSPEMESNLAGRGPDKRRGRLVHGPNRSLVNIPVSPSSP